MKLKSCLLAMLWPALNAFAQSAPIRFLSVGDTVPPVLLSNIVNYPVSKIQLSSFRGKGIILDFWDRSCISCIRALPAIDSLQQLYKSQLQIFTIADYRNKEDVKKTLARFLATRNLHLPVVLPPHSLRQLFPYELVSHVVWIGKQGVVQAITGTEYITASNIETFLADKPLNWPVKNDNLTYDPEKPLFGILQQGIRPSFLYQSAFTGHMQGVSPPNGTRIDSSSATAVTGFYNKTLLALCRIAMDYRTNSALDNFILDVKDSTRYLMNKGQYHAVWDRANTYCYSVQLPARMKPVEIKQFIQSDLIRWLSLLNIRLSRQHDKILVSDK